MSASAEIFRFPGRSAGGNGAWSSQEIADVYRALDMFARHGLSVEAASGMSEEGDPWFAIEDTSSGDALIHIARIDGFFIVHVLDGETWSGDSLREALSQVDMGALAALDGVAYGHAGADTDGGDDDRDGTHAFLRIVSAVVAVLTADVIANAVTHEAAASPLPSSDAPYAGDHTTDSNRAALDLPDVAAALPAAHKQSAPTPAPVEDAAASAPVERQDRAADHQSVASAAPVATAVSAPVATDPVEAPAATVDAAFVTQKPQAIVAVMEREQGVALSFVFEGGDHVKVTYDDHAVFVGTQDKADMFLVLLGKEDQSVTTKVANFETGHDSLVIEKSGDGSTSSAIITDLGALVASNIQQLTVVGQATTEVHLSAAVTGLVGGG